MNNNNYYYHYHNSNGENVLKVYRCCCFEFKMKLSYYQNTVIK